MKRYLLKEKIIRLTRTLFVAAVMVACTTQSLPAWAQSDELYAAFKQYQALNKQGKYAEAIPFAQTFIALAEEEFGETHKIFAVSLNSLATLYYNQGRYADAEPLYKRSLAIREKALGPDHPNVALSLENFESLDRFQGRYADAEPLYKRALAISVNTNGNNAGNYGSGGSGGSTNKTGLTSNGGAGSAGFVYIIDYR
jgi:tetratricopeptide (TPR) repeat protein